MSDCQWHYGRSSTTMEMRPTMSANLPRGRSFIAKYHHRLRDTRFSEASTTMEMMVSKSSPTNTICKWATTMEFSAKCKQCVTVFGSCNEFHSTWKGLQWVCSGTVIKSWVLNPNNLYFKWVPNKSGWWLFKTKTSLYQTICFKLISNFKTKINQILFGIILWIYPKHFTA